jgi:hypothetical protein
MKNEHLIPVNIQDIVNRLRETGLSTNEKLVLLQRLEAIRDFCDESYKKFNYVDLGQVYSGRK